MTPGGRSAVFLDRDGTLVEERDYLADPEEVTLVPGAARALAELHAAGLALVVVTNQSGIARGLYREEDYQAVAARIEALLADEGVRLDAVFHCPHHPDHSGPCACRKPGTGMHRRAATELGLSLKDSWFVGDKPSDVEPARLLGGRAILVRTGYGREWEGSLSPEVGVADDLPAAARRILEEVRSGVAANAG